MRRDSDKEACLQALGSIIYRLAVVFALFALFYRDRHQNNEIAELRMMLKERGLRFAEEKTGSTSIHAEASGVESAGARLGEIRDNTLEAWDEQLDGEDVGLARREEVRLHRARRQAGCSCTKGQPGLPGPPGPPGLQGPNGRPGDDGPPAPRGHPGSGGEKGDKGEIGQKGERGEMGLSGKGGKPGQPGQPGQPGPTGPRGQTGNKGHAGKKGTVYRLKLGSIITLFAGKNGEKGEKGPAGQCESCNETLTYAQMYLSNSPDRTTQHVVYPGVIPWVYPSLNDVHHVAVEVHLEKRVLKILLSGVYMIDCRVTYYAQSVPTYLQIVNSSLEEILVETQIPGSDDASGSCSGEDIGLCSCSDQKLIRAHYVGYLSKGSIVKTKLFYGNGNLTCKKLIALPSKWETYFVVTLISGSGE